MIGLKGLFWKFFPPLEVKATVTEIENFYKDCGFFIGKGLCEARAKARVKGNVEIIIYAVRIEHKKPEYIALFTITNTLGELLSSGYYHFYRGHLDMVGKDMLKVWDRAIDLLHTRGYYTNEEAEEDRKWIREQIAVMG